MQVVLDLDTADIEAVVQLLEAMPVNTVSTSIAWSIAEPTSGQFNFEPYRKAFQRLVDEGYCLNVILDTSGRQLIGEDRKPQANSSAIPNWLADRLHTRPFAHDFYNEETSAMLSVADTEHLPFVDRFYERSLEFLANFRSNVAFVTPGVSPELEVKYAQNGYRFQDYSPDAKRLFRKYMTSIEKPEADMPVIDYQAFFNGGAPKEHPFRDDLQEFRKDLLVRYYCGRTATIRSHDFKAFGYFGGPFQLHDMIYGSGVIEKVPGCFDGIAIDHNFFNGHGLDVRPEYVTTIVNYAANRGFKEIIIGLYTERLGFAGMSARDIAETLANALQAVMPDEAIAGIEVGGFEIAHPSAREVFSPHLSNLIDSAIRKEEQKKYTVVVLGSFQTFELWQGEYFFNRSIHQDALMAAVKMLGSRPDIAVKVVSEANLEQHASSADAIYLPHVTAPSAATVRTIKKLIALGKPVVQDVRFAEFRPDGSMAPDYPVSGFGVSRSQWMADGGDFSYDGEIISLPAQAKDFYASHIEMSAAAGFSLSLKSSENGGIFLSGPNTLVLGIMPQFLDEFWQTVALDEIIKLMNRQHGALKH